MMSTTTRSSMLAADLAQQIEIDRLGVVFRIVASAPSKNDACARRGAVGDRVQRARGAHQLEDFLADAVHVDGERDAAETDQRNAKLLLAHDPPPARAIDAFARDHAEQKAASGSRCSPCPSARLLPLHGLRRFDAHRLQAVVSELLHNLFSMRAVARFDRDIEPGALCRHIEKQPSVVDLEDIGPKLPQPCAICPSTPGRSGIVSRNATMRSSRSSSRTMIEARMRGSMLPPHRIRPTLRRRKRSGSTSKAASPAAPAPFGHRLLQGKIGIDRALELHLVDQDDLGDELAHDRQRQRADVLHRDAFGQCRAAERPVVAVQAHSRKRDRARPRRRRSRSRA